jgi:hypothetical protein
MKLGDGLFMRCCEEVALLYPNIGNSKHHQRLVNAGDTKLWYRER